MNRRNFLLRSLLGSLAIPPLTGAAAYAQAMSFVVTKHQLKLPKLEQPVKIAHLTDLHFTAAHKKQHLEAWVKTTLLEQPDVVLLTGDIVHGDIFRRLGNKAKPTLEELGKALKPLTQVPLGAYAVLGNHDYALRWSGTSSVRQLEQVLEQNGIKMLTNQNTRLRPDLFVAGIDDLWHGAPDLGAALRGIPDTAATLLLSHNPDVLLTVPSSVGLMLCGHTHGGQVRLPFFGALASVTEFGERYQQGFIQEQTLGFVSRGLGCGTLPIRLFCPAELVLLECLPQN
jgi:uncharacterized protein